MLRKPSQARVQFCTRVCQKNARIKRPTGTIHNGRPGRLNDKGYVLLWEPEHPNSMRGWAFEHRLVAESILGRYLTSEEQVDHINTIRNDNRPENLQVLNASDHSKKTNADNLGALKVLRSRIANLEQELESLRTEAEHLSE